MEESLDNPQACHFLMSRCDPDEKKGTLFLLPTPISEEVPLSSFSKDLIQTLEHRSRKKIYYLVEEKATFYRRWRLWGFERPLEDQVLLLNEHTQQGELSYCEEIGRYLQEGHHLLFCSDAGVPLFCDPGLIFVQWCYQKNLPVYLFPIENAPLAAFIYAAFDSEHMESFGFLPHRDQEERISFWDKVLEKNHPCLVMDTPYRLVKTLKELWEMTLWKEKKTKGTWQCSLALDLFSSQEEIWRGSPDDLWLRIQKANQTKRQFVLVIYRKRIHGEKDERTKKTSEKKIIQKTTFEKKGRPEEKRSSVTRKKSTGRVWKKR